MGKRSDFYREALKFTKRYFTAFEYTTEVMTNYYKIEALVDIQDLIFEHGDPNQWSVVEGLLDQTFKTMHTAVLAWQFAEAFMDDIVNS